MKILEAMFLTRSEYARVHFTPKGCLKAGRPLIKAAQEYQANRLETRKPPLLEAIRESVAELEDNQISIFSHYDVEADDGVIMDSYTFLDRDIVIWSEDKDLRCTPAPYWEQKTGTVDKIKDRFGWIAMSYTEGGSLKCIGHGTKFFWLQMLMGDQADNIKGLKSYNGKPIGPARAYDLIKDFTSEKECAAFVLDCYKAINQDIIPEGKLLWLLRSADDSFEKYLKELT